MNMMKLLLPLILLSSCTAIPDVAKTLDDIATDNAIKIEVNKEALQKDSNVKINVDILNGKVSP